MKRENKAVIKKPLKVSPRFLNHISPFSLIEEHNVKDNEGVLKAWNILHPNRWLMGRILKHWVNDSFPQATNKLCVCGVPTWLSNRAHTSTNNDHLPTDQNALKNWMSLQFIYLPYSNSWICLLTWVWRGISPPPCLQHLLEEVHNINKLQLQQVFVV